METEGPNLTLIVPCYNEAQNIPVFVKAATACFDAADVVVETVFVNDGSSDDTLDVLKQVVQDTDARHPIQVIGFSRNFGKEAAMYAGLEAARGSFVGFIDADMQQDPADALKMYQMLLEHDEYDSVAACQQNRREGLMLKFFKRAFYRTFNGVADDIDIPANVSDFRVFRREVADALLSMTEYDRFSKGLFAWVGFKTYAMPYTPRVRNAGNSSWSFSKLFKYAMTGIFGFTTWPLRVVSWMGGFITLAALVYLIMVVGEYLVMGIDVPGYPTLVCLVLFFGGMNLLVMGVVGEYIARDYIQDKNRPLYIERCRFDSASDERGHL